MSPTKRKCNLHDNDFEEIIVSLHTEQTKPKTELIMYKRFLSAALVAALFCPTSTMAQSEIYPQHFNLSEVVLLDGPMKTMMETNDELLLKYDADRLMTPFIRQAGLSKDATSKYNGWETAHPSFANWGQKDWSL